jgi:glutathione S-transferase
MLKLFTASGTCALAVHIALEESRAPYETVRVDVRNNAQRSPEYLALNPMGRVPLLITEQGPLTETPALLIYIAQAFPQSGLAPLDPFALAQVQAFNSYLASTVHVAHAHGRRGARWADGPEAHQAMARKVAQNMTDCFTLIEQRLFKGPWVMGDTYTVCDPYLFTIAGWLESDGVDPTQFPKVHRFTQRMAERAAVKRVLEAANAA